MPLYEHVYLARPDLAPAQVEGLTETMTKIVADHGGEVKGSEYWGLRNIAYRIEKNRKAHYVLLNIDAPAESIKELERQAAISEDILRWLTVRVEKLAEEPSPMLRRAEKDRGRRGRDEGLF
jgi:small subunit ribosomal protein S6